MATTASPQDQTQAPPPSLKPSTLHLSFLDGLRGLAALFVMLSHAFGLGAHNGESAGNNQLNPHFIAAFQIMENAHYAVGVFIVLSGFCLMLPVAKSKDRSLQGGLWGFLVRRCRRILPPYYAALVVIIGIVLGSHTLLGHHSGRPADLSVANVATHILLIHNLFLQYYTAIDPPMWSVALEWQIYFIFALALIPVWRKFGTHAALALSVVLGYGLDLLPAPYNLHWTSPWFVTLFGFGMAAAARYIDPRPLNYKLVNAATFITLAGLVVVQIGYQLSWFKDPRAPWMGTDFLVGAASSLIILVCAKNETMTPFHSALLKLFTSRAAVAVGAFSYSLYLIHHPILVKFRDIMVNRHMPHDVQLMVLYGVAVPLSLAAAYVFHLLFERPFLVKRPKPAAVMPA